MHPPQLTPPAFTVPSQNTTESQGFLAWPEVRRLLQINTSLPQWNSIEKTAEQWLVDVSGQFGHDLPIDKHMKIRFTDIDELAEGQGQEFKFLSRSYVELSCEVYFESFHTIYPILDAQQFSTTTLPRICNNSFDEGDEGSAIVLAVIALGELAHEGATGEPVVNEAGHTASGVRGGTVSRPPGLSLIHEAQRRLGLMFTKWTLASLQCHILMA